MSKTCCNNIFQLSLFKDSDTRIAKDGKKIGKTSREYTIECADWGNKCIYNNEHECNLLLQNFEEDKENGIVRIETDKKKCGINCPYYATKR